MTVLTGLASGLGSVVLAYAAWMASLVKGGDYVQISQVYMYCFLAFLLILVGQINTFKLVPALIGVSAKEPSFNERIALHEFRTFSVRQGEYYKRAQSAI